MNQDQRYIGQPRPSYKYPGPSDYDLSNQQIYKKQAQHSFKKAERVIDFVKFRNGNEILIEKGLI